MYVSSLNVENLRCFERAKIAFEHPDTNVKAKADRVENVTLLLGNNGSGKTTILKGVALAVLAPVIPAAGYKPHCLVRRHAGPPSPTVANVTAALVFMEQDYNYAADMRADSLPAKATAKILSRGDYEMMMTSAEYSSTAIDSEERTVSEQLLEDDSPAYFTVAYGATRRVASANGSEVFSEKSRGLRYQRVASLFEDHVPLRPLNLWVPGLESKRRSAAINLLNTLTPEDISFDGRFDDLQPIFTHRGIDLPFTTLSDGYRGYIGMVADLLHHLNHACPDGRELTEMTGVVLIDDIDLHLHPSWQLSVVPKLASTLPRLQFIVTSHSPLVAATLYARNIRVIESPPDRPSRVNDVQERIHGLNAAQVLSSEYFGLPSSRSQDQEDKLARLADDVAKRGSPEASIAFLRELSGKNPE